MHQPHYQIKSKGEKLLFPLDRSEPITSDQWSEITRINAELSKEYRCRRAMVLKRLDVTIQSFLWSDRAKVTILVLLPVSHRVLNSFIDNLHIQIIIL